MVILIFAAVLLILIIAVMFFVRTMPFGSLPSGEELERIKKSPNYKDGKFRNIHATPNISPGVSYTTLLKDFFLERKKDVKPPAPLPSKKTDLLNLDPEENVLVWFGHSSYFIQVDSKKILVDPVFSGAASPVKFTTRSFAGADVYSVDDMPEIDFLFITHDHWDHLDYETVTKLKPKVKKLICSFGVAAHLDRWGFDEKIIIERDWNENFSIAEGFDVTVLPARHFSGRGFVHRKSLWSSFFLKTPTRKIYLGGDSGYDDHFAEIGNKYGPMDLAILECGQYDKNWKLIHMMPEETFRAAEDLKARKLLPVHWGKFSLSNHSWDDSIKRISIASYNKDIDLLTPMIGEAVDLDHAHQTFNEWWERV